MPKGARPSCWSATTPPTAFPQRYGDLGLTLAQRLMHIAWDPGALAVCHRLSELLDAPLVHSTVSRLVIDCNRDPTSPELIWTLSEDTDNPRQYGIGARSAKGGSTTITPPSTPRSKRC